MFRHPDVDPFVVTSWAERRAREYWAADGCRYGQDLEHWYLAFFEAVLAHCQVQQEAPRLAVFFYHTSRDDIVLSKLYGQAASRIRRWRNPAVQVRLECSVETMRDTFVNRQGNDHPLVACFCPMDRNLRGWQSSILTAVLGAMIEKGVPWYTDSSVILEMTGDSDGINALDFSQSGLVADRMLLDLLT